MKKILLGIYFLEVVLLAMTLLEFIYLDKKMTQVTEKQLEYNASIKTTLDEQAKKIRLLSTDCLVLTNIVTSGEYVKQED